LAGDSWHALIRHNDIADKDIELMETLLLQRHPRFRRDQLYLPFCRNEAPFCAIFIGLSGNMVCNLYSNFKLHKFPILKGALAKSMQASNM